MAEVIFDKWGLKITHHKGKELTPMERGLYYSMMVAGVMMVVYATIIISPC